MCLCCLNDKSSLVEFICCLVFTLFFIENFCRQLAILITKYGKTSAQPDYTLFITCRLLNHYLTFPKWYKCSRWLVACLADLPVRSAFSWKPWQNAVHKCLRPPLLCTTHMRQGNGSPDLCKKKNGLFPKHLASIYDDAADEQDMDGWSTQCELGVVHDHCTRLCRGVESNFLPQAQ